MSTTFLPPFSHDLCRLTVLLALICLYIHTQPGDAIIDGGNEWFPNSIRRAEALAPKVRANHSSAPPSPLSFSYSRHLHTYMYLYIHTGYPLYGHGYLRW